MEIIALRAMVLIWRVRIVPLTAEVIVGNSAPTILTRLVFPRSNFDLGTGLQLSLYAPQIGSGRGICRNAFPEAQFNLSRKIGSKLIVARRGIKELFVVSDFDDFRACLRGCSSIIAPARGMLSYTF